MNKRLNSMLTQLERRVKRHVRMGLFSTLDRQAWCQILIGQLKAWETLQTQRAAWMEAEKNGDAERSAQAQDAYMKTFEYHRNVTEIAHEIELRVKEQRDRVLGKPGTKPLTDYEVELMAKDSRIATHVPRLYLGMLQQTCDLYSGNLGLIYRAEQGDQEAREQIQNKMGRLLRGLEREYQRCGLLKEEVHSITWEAICAATEEWPKNRYLGFLQWIAGRIRRKVSENKTTLLHTRQKECPQLEHLFTDRDASDDENGDDGETASHRSLRPSSTGGDSSKYVLVREAAARIGRSAQTLRNWDKAGLTKARWKQLGQRKYRVYYESDFPRLHQLRDIQKARMLHKRENYWSLRELAQVSGCSAKTIIRKEMAGILPSPRRNSHNHRIYSRAAIEKIAKLLPSKTRP